MRKCGECGYLLFGDGEICNHCGAALPGVTVGAPARAATATGPAPAPNPAPSPAASPAPAPAPSPAAAPPAPAPAPPPPGLWSGPSIQAPPPPPTTAPAPEFWRPEPIITGPPARRKGSPVKKFLTIAVAVVLCGLAAAFVVAWRNRVPEGTRDFVEGKGVLFTAPDGSYTAKFPTAPKVSSQAVNSGAASMTVTTAESSNDSYEMGTATMVLPVAVSPAQVDTLLEGALQGGVSGAKGDLVSKTRITRGGLPAIEGKFKAPDGYSAHVTVIASGSRLYVLFVHASSATDKLFAALDKSFVPQTAGI